MMSYFILAKSQLIDHKIATLQLKTGCFFYMILSNGINKFFSLSSLSLSLSLPPKNR